MSTLDDTPLGPHTATPAELRERLLAERQGDPVLVWRGEDKRQVLLPLHPGLQRVTIGRGPSNDVALGWDTEVSRLHAELERLAGEWTVEPDAVLLHEPGGRIADRFSARDVHLVMAPAAGANPVRFSVRLDGQPPGPDHGDDVDDDGTGTVTEPRLHHLVRQRGPITDRTFEITFHDPGVQAFAFTFG